MTTLGDLIGAANEEEFESFDFSEIQEVLNTLQIDQAVDLPQAERMQTLALRGADLISNYSGKLVKTMGYLEAELNRSKNEVLLNYEAPKEKKVKTTADMRKAAAEVDPDVLKAHIKLSRAKAAKVALDKKYDIIIKAHHLHKDIAAGFKRTLALTGGNSSEPANTW